MSKITIIVPIYRVKTEYLKKCITSIEEQTLQDIEVILVNDGASKNIANICNEYAKKDERIKVIHKENAGVSSARNVGLKNIKSNYIMFVDSDDWIEKECCKKVYDEIEKNPKIDILCYSYFKNYKKVEKTNNIFEITQLINCNKTDHNYYNMKIIGSTWAKVYSKSILENEYFNENLLNGEDVEFNFRIFNKAKYILEMSEVLYHYRIREDSAVRRYNEDTIKRYNETIEYIKQDIEQISEPNKHQIQAYYSFGAVAYLIICMNMIFTKEYRKSYFKKVQTLKKLSKKEPYKDILKNSKYVILPFTRKLPLMFAKYNMYFLLNIMIKIKRRLMSR